MALQHSAPRDRMYAWILKSLSMMQRTCYKNVPMTLNPVIFQRAIHDINLVYLKNITDAKCCLYFLDIK